VRRLRKKVQRKKGKEEPLTLTPNGMKFGVPNQPKVRVPPQGEDPES